MQGLNLKWFGELSDTPSINSSYMKQLTLMVFNKNGPSSASFSFIFIFSNKLQVLQQINVKNVNPLYDAGIRTNDLWNMSLLPGPLDQGSRPLTILFIACQC